MNHWEALLFVCLAMSGSADRNSLNNTVMAGYQGWFEGPAGPAHKWRHWSRTGKKPVPPPSGTNTGLAFDLWPDTAEYKKLYDTGLHMEDGSVAQLYSAQDYSTVSIHMQWAREYNIDGFFLQRFVHSLTDPTFLKAKNIVLSNVCKAAEANNRTFAMMYDLSGAPDETLFDVIASDWEWIVNQNYTRSSAYQFHDGRPVLAIWGWGMKTRNQSKTQALRLINHLRGTPAKLTIMGGMPYYWRTGDHDSKAGWDSVYAAFDIVSPWSVGRYKSVTEFDKKFRDVVSPDLDKIKNKQYYAPVVWPGFTRSNLEDDPSVYNEVPRNCGEFFNHQASTLVQAKAILFFYIAMFDEVNEGTAIFKAATSRNTTPTDARFSYLDLDLCGNVSSDHYLTLAGSIYN